MSTRALYTFYPGEDGWPEQPIHVYVHHDGYPIGAAEKIVAALKYAWPLPRYEHDEFAAAFVAANKRDGGGVRLCAGGDFDDVAPRDIEYWYTISPKKTKGGTQLIVTAYDVAHSDGDKSTWSISKLFTAPLKSGDTLKAKAKEY